MHSHTVTPRGPRGEPPQLVCGEHPGCTWRRDLAPMARQGDAIALALLAAHVRDVKGPLLPMMGHPKRTRI